MAAHVGLKRILSAAKTRQSKSYLNAVSRFQREERGSILIMSLFFLILMLLVTGMSVDLMRSETQRARLQSTLDRAILAGASLDQTLDSEDVVRDYFAKAGLTEYLTDVQVVEGQNSKTVTATAQTSVDTMFMKMMGINNLKSPASGQAEESLKNIEISLVVDISGSMGSYSYAGGDYKIDLLQDAASDFVYLMQCNPDDNDSTGACTVEENTVSISLVPYAEQVLVGENLLQKFNVTNEHTASSCADFVTSDFNQPAISLTSNLRRAATIDKYSNYRSSRSSSVWASDSRRSCRTGDYRKIKPLSNSYSDLQTQIYQLRADGNTSIDLGMKWGAALLDPSFRPAVQVMTTGGLPAINSAFSARPFDYNERSMQKVIVLMTDGVNTTQHVIRDGFRYGPSKIYTNDDGSISSSQIKLSAYSSSRGQYYYPHNDTWNNQPYGDGSDTSCSYWSGCTTTPQPGSAHELDFAEFWQDYNVDYYEEAFWFLPDPSTSNGNSTKNSRLSSICTAAKAKGIEVFTIGFETSGSSNAVMRACASSDAHHFDVNGLSLDDAFTSIAREIHELRLTL
ncbi:MAG: pilus assembly protein TadG-related protein [Marinosulfonomonas sp.]